MTGYKSKRAAAQDKLAQPEQEPVAWTGYEGSYKILTRQRQIADAYPEIYTVALYPHPKRPWVGLTAEEAAECWTTSATQTWKNFETKLKEKNNG